MPWHRDALEPGRSDFPGRSGLLARRSDPARLDSLTCSHAGGITDFWRNGDRLWLLDGMPPFRPVPFPSGLPRIGLDRLPRPVESAEAGRTPCAEDRLPADRAAI